jgi:hypothetical protein
MLVHGAQTEPQVRSHRWIGEPGFIVDESRCDATLARGQRIEK